MARTSTRHNKALLPDLALLLNVSNTVECIRKNPEQEILFGDLLELAGGKRVV